MTTTRHRQCHGKALLALLAATAALAGAQALAPATAGAMIDQSISQARCELLFGEWRWEGLDEFCVLNFGGGGGGSGPSYGGVNGGGGSTGENGRNDAGGTPAKSEAYRQAEQNGLRARLKEAELLLRDHAAWLTGEREGVAERQACREIRRDIQYFQGQWLEDDDPDVSPGYRFFRGFGSKGGLAPPLERQVAKWKRKDCDNVLPTRGW